MFQVPLSYWAEVNCSANTFGVFDGYFHILERAGVLEFDPNRTGSFCREGEGLLRG
jgi:hypothetical protein